MSTSDTPVPSRAALRERQSRLARAVRLADQGDLEGARRLVHSVLAEDPEFAPALALLDRLHQRPLPAQTPARVGAAGGARSWVGNAASTRDRAAPQPPPGSSGAPALHSNAAKGSWAQFEQRMRLRRETTCLTAMRQAMDAGDFATALARANELVELDPNYNDVRVLLEDQVRATQAAAPTPKPRHATSERPRPMPAGLAVQPLAVPSPVRAAHSPRRTRMLLALILIALAAVAGWGITIAWSSGRLAEWTERVWPSAPADQQADAVPPLAATRMPPAAEPEIPNLPPIGEPPQKPDVVSGSAATASGHTNEPAIDNAVSGNASPSPADGKAISQNRNATPPQGPPASQAPRNTPSAAATSPADKPIPPASRSVTKPIPPASQSVTNPIPPASQSAAKPIPPASQSADTTRSTTLPRDEIGDPRIQILPALPPPEPPRGASAAPTESTANSATRPAPPPSPSRDEATATYGTHLPSTTATAGELDEERSIQETLTAYQQGYTSLDAGAVRRVWPRVNAQALRSAFGQLESQRIAFQGCSIDVRGLHAAAICRGTATYIPKVGSGEAVSMQRTWDFALRKFGDNWLIDAATSR